MSLNEILIVIAIVVGVFVLFFFFMEISVRRETKRDSSNRSAKRQHEVRLEQSRKLERIKRYPIKELTQKEFDKIPMADDLEEGFLKTCPIGFWFVCRKSDLASNIIVIGQVVKGDDAFCEQIGSALLSLQEREINRYRVKIIKLAEKEAEIVAEAR